MNKQELQELIAWLKGEKAVSHQKCMEFQKMAQKIALTSLMVEPEMWEINNPGEGSYFMPEKPLEGDYRLDLIRREWYTTPPAPVDLAALVPPMPEWDDILWDVSCDDVASALSGAEYMRDEMLRRIEEVKK